MCIAEVNLMKNRKWEIYKYGPSLAYFSERVHYYFHYLFEIFFCFSISLLFDLVHGKYVIIAFQKSYSCPCYLLYYFIISHKLRLLKYTVYHCKKPEKIQKKGNNFSTLYSFPIYPSYKNKSFKGR